MINNVLLEQEYKRRGITVSTRELQEAADYAPPPAIQQAPELQTNGRFDIDKYRRYRNSPSARQSGLNLYHSSSTTATRSAARSCSTRSRPVRTSPTPASGRRGRTPTTRRG